MNSISRVLLSVHRNLQNCVKRSLTSKCAVVPTPLETSESDKNILVSEIGSVTLIGINRPAKKNCLNNAAAEELLSALDAFEANDESEIGIIHGIGGTFCSGFDLEEIAKCEEDNLPHFGPMWSRNELTKKPLIAAISGYAVGVGIELALMCDLRVVEAPARLAFLNRRLGIPIMCGGTVRLPAMVGYSRANDLILTGREITGEEAFHWGIANRLVTCGSALGECITLAQSIKKFPKGPLLADRASLHAATFGVNSIEEKLQNEKDIAANMLLKHGKDGAKKFVNGFGRHGKSKNLTSYNATNFRPLDDNLL